MNISLIVFILLPVLIGKAVLLLATLLVYRVGKKEDIEKEKLLEALENAELNSLSDKILMNFNSRVSFHKCDEIRISFWPFNVRYYYHNMDDSKYFIIFDRDLTKAIDEKFRKLENFH